MEEIIKIDGMMPEVAKTTGKKYTAFHTSIGKIGVFEDDVIKELSKYLGEFVRVEIAIRPNGYKNIIKCLGKAEGITETEKQATTNNKNMDTNEKIGNEIIHRVITEMIDNTRKNSIEFGKAENRVKVYFSDIEDFKTQYENLILAKRAIDNKLNSDEAK